MRKILLTMNIIVLVVLCSGCGLLIGRAGVNLVGTAMDKAATTAGEKVGQAVGESVGKSMAGYATASLRGLTPAMMQLYVSTIFSSFFYAGGYHFDVFNTYQPGDWTRWKATGMDEGEEFQKAFLKREDDGKEWWQIVSFAVREGNREEVVLEALFSAPDEAGIRKLLRLRGLFPGDREPAEIPVQENTSAWYHEPIRLTEESIKAATKGTETITNPAGTFIAQHVVYRDAYGVGDWWLTDKVPGGLIKYQVTDPQIQGEKYVVELVAYGKDAKSRLGSF